MSADDEKLEAEIFIDNCVIDLRKMMIRFYMKGNKYGNMMKKNSNILCDTNELLPRV